VERLVDLRRPADFLARDRHFADVAAIGPRHQLAEGDRAFVLLNLVESSRSARQRRRARPRTTGSSQSGSRRASHGRSTGSHTRLSLKITTACAGSVTRNASSIP
jgi:hypothetical protein